VVEDGAARFEFATQHSKILLEAEPSNETLRKSVIDYMFITMHCIARVCSDWKITGADLQESQYQEKTAIFLQNPSDDTHTHLMLDLMSVIRSKLTTSTTSSSNSTSIFSDGVVVVDADESGNGLVNINTDAERRDETLAVAAAGDAVDKSGNVNGDKMEEDGPADINTDAERRDETLAVAAALDAVDERAPLEQRPAVHAAVAGAEDAKRRRCAGLERKHAFDERITRRRSGQFEARIGGATGDGIVTDHAAIEGVLALSRAADLEASAARVRRRSGVRA
jgi:hypothetical protein